MLREALFAQNRIFAKIHTFPAQSDFYHEITHLRSKMHFWLKNAILRILDQKASIWHLFLHGLAQNAKTCDFVKNLRAQENLKNVFCPKGFSQIIFQTFAKSAFRTCRVSLHSCSVAGSHLGQYRGFGGKPYFELILGIFVKIQISCTFLTFAGLGGRVRQTQVIPKEF